MKIYFNIKTVHGTETVDELNSEDFTTFQEFRDEKKRLLKEYRIASDCYSSIYTSQRSTNDWI